MPAIHGGASEELIEHLETEYVENGPFDDLSEVVNYCLRRVAYQENGKKFDY